MFSRLSKNHAPNEQITILSQRGRSSCLDVFCEKVLATLLRKRVWNRCFPVTFAKIFKSTFFIEHLRWLLLNRIRKTKYDIKTLSYLGPKL